MKTLPRFFALVLLPFALAAAAGQVYKWVDPQGGIHYADTPQPGWKPVDLSNNPTVTGGDATPGPAPSDAAAEDASGAAGDEASAALKAEQCKSAQNRLTQYKRSSKIVERDNLGKEKEYTPQERLQLLERTQQEVKLYCGGSDDQQAE